METVLLEKKFFITEEQVVTPAEILMGAFTDADKNIYKWNLLR